MTSIKEPFAIPAAYFITFVCYGTWLHGNSESSVDRNNNIYNTPFLAPNDTRLTKEIDLMHEAIYLLDQTRRKIVLQAIKEVCIHRSWHLLAAHIRTNHVHLVIDAVAKPEYILSTIKSYASRHLNRSRLDIDRACRWARHGSTRYLWKRESVEAAMNYVVYEQGTPMEVYDIRSEPRS